MDLSQGSQPAADPVTVYVVPLVLALLGIGGVAIGAWIAARSALRSRLIDLNVAEAEAERAFGIRAVGVVANLGIATHHLIEDLQQRGEKIASDANGHPVSVMLSLDATRSKQVERLTDEWRAVLAEAQFYTAGRLADALYAFDQQREIVVKDVNSARTEQDLAKALRDCDVWREHHARQVYRLFQIDKVQGRARVYRLAHVWRLRRFAKQLDDALVQAMRDGHDLVTSADKARASEPTESGGDPGPAAKG